MTPMLSSKTAVASGIRRPPFLYLACLVLGFALDRLLPLPLSYPEARLICSIGGGALILTGVAIMAAGARNFSRAGTPVRSNQPVRALVTSGIHGWSVGMLLLYAGIGTAARSPWVLILALPLIIILRYGVIAREETYLERRFGDAYLHYKKRVRRWL
jgi:protein-S-isoprenylcysteine O-methyltransferase Ste14